MKKQEQRDMANRIKLRRKSLHYTQEQSAEIVGISANSYTRIENAFQRPSLNTLIKIAQHLDLSLDYITFGDDENKPKDVTNAEYLNNILKHADKDKLLHASELLSKIANIAQTEPPS